MNVIKTLGEFSGCSKGQKDVISQIKKAIQSKDYNLARILSSELEDYFGEFHHEHNLEVAKKLYQEVMTMYELKQTD